MVRLETREEPRFEGCQDRWTFGEWKIDLHREAEKNSLTVVEIFHLQKLEANSRPESMESESGLLYFPRLPFFGNDLAIKLRC